MSLKHEGDRDDNYRNNEMQNQENQRRAPEYSFWAEQTYHKTSSPTGSENYSLDRDGDVWEYQQGIEPQQKKKKSFMAFLMQAVCFGIIAGVSFWGFQEFYYAVNPNARQLVIEKEMDTGYSVNNKLNLDPPGRTEEKIQTTSSGSPKSTARSIISNVVDNTMPSIVSIRSISSQSYLWFGQENVEESESSGSGIIVGKNDKELLIATNNHVVEGTDRITVTFMDGNSVEAVIKGTDATADLAVITVDLSQLKKDTIDSIKIAKLGNSDQVKVGEMAIAIGNALGYGQSVTVGYISAKDRKVDVSDGYRYRTMVLLQTDAAINPGNSGGALLNINGEVIGINTIKYASKEVEGMGYAIPISKAMPIINELMKREILSTEEQGFLGVVNPNDVTEEVAETYNMPIGVFITDVLEDSAAEKAGILPGDIITKLNGIEITSRVQLSEKIASIRVGSEVEITFMRSSEGVYKEQTVTAMLGVRPQE